MDSEPGTIEPQDSGPSRRDSKHLVAASAIVAATTLAAKATGLLREAASAAAFGANRAMDAFVVAKSIPDMVSTWIEMPVRSAFVPLFTRALEHDGEEQAWRAASNVLNCVFCLVALLSLLLLFGSSWLVRALSTGFGSEAAWAEGTRLAQVMVLSVAFSVAAFLLGSISNVYRRQIVPGLARLAGGLVVLAAVVVAGPRFGLAGYAWGILAGAIVTFLVQTDVLWRHRRLYRPILRPRAPEVREMLSLAWPLFIGLTGTRLDVVIDRNFASHLPPGHLSLLLYATFLAATLTELMMNISQSVLLPHFSRLAASDQHSELKLRAMQAVASYLFFMAPLTAFVCGAAYPLVRLVFGRGRFTAEDVALTALLVPILAIADPAFGVGQVFAQAHISLGDTRTPMNAGFIRIGFKTATSLLLVPLAGIFGLASSSALSALLRCWILWRRLPSSVRPERLTMFGAVGWFALSAAVGGLGVWGLLAVLPGSDAGPVVQAGRLACAGCLALVLHLALAWIAGNPLLRMILASLRSALASR